MKTLKEYQKLAKVGNFNKLHRRVGSNTMIHYVGDTETLCGIKIETPIQNIDPYDGSSIVDKGGMIVTGFFSPLYYDQCGTDRKAQPRVKPTCAECSRLYQQKLYHCSVHGFLSGREVTYSEKCDYCGSSV